MKQLYIIVHEFGDLDAGILPSTWVIKDVEIIEPEDREKIREAFSAAFELITSGSYSVIFSDELPPEYGDEK